MTREPEFPTRAIDPARLASGQWCHRREKTLGEGDIHASYSADRIGMGEPVRKPFLWEGKPWVCTSFAWHGGNVRAEAYRLAHPSVFDGMPTTYTAKLADSDAARADPLGFYHGMTVRHGGATLVLCGPPLILVPGQAEQLALF